MTPLEYALAAQGIVAIINALKASQPVATPDKPLTPEEKAAVDSANLAMNTAVAGWDAATKPTT
jgi:hypothetical protein